MHRKKILPWILFSLFLIFLLVLLYLYVRKDKITANVIKEESAGLEVFFCPNDKCQNKLLELINMSAEIKCAFYELNLKEVIKALQEKNAEVVIEDSNRLEGFYSGYSFALMHNKFCVFDKRIVFTGSMNPTENDNFYNNNNILIIDSAAVSKNYLDEFDELKRNIYGKGEKVRYPYVKINDMLIENYFCPEDDCKSHVLDALRKANSSIYFMTFSFTDPDIGNLVYNKRYSGLDVKGIFKSRQISDFSNYEKLKEASIIDKNPRTMHHKVFIIDNKTVITGSFNPSKNADERNDENIIIIHDEKVARKYADEFSRLFYFEKKFPTMSSDLVLSEISYNPIGKDEKNEYVKIRNLGKSEIDLGYYSINDNQTSSRLSGSLLPGEEKIIYPKFTLKNTAGIIILSHNDKIIDYASWDKSLMTKEGDVLIKADFTKTGKEAWTFK